MSPTKAVGCAILGVLSILFAVAIGKSVASPRA